MLLYFYEIPQCVIGVLQETHQPDGQHGKSEWTYQERNHKQNDTVLNRVSNQHRQSLKAHYRSGKAEHKRREI